MAIAQKKVCIIKLASRGDVLRSTSILWCFPDAEITWITREVSVPLLDKNPFIKKVITPSEILRPEKMVFDELYNFDEEITACRLAVNIRAGKKKGYGLRNDEYFPFDSDSEFAYKLSKNDELKFKSNKKTYQQIMFEMAGLRWDGEDYILGYKPNSKIQHRFGINYLSGEKFPNKAWPHWKKLADMLDSVSLQREFGDIESYVDWINSCRMIITGDSLGMHIALALKKKVVILMGSTSWDEIETYNRGIILNSRLPCSPCYKRIRCEIKPNCMDLIIPERVYSAIKRIEEADTAFSLANEIK